MPYASFRPAGTAMASLHGLPIVVVGVAQGWHGDGKPTWLAYCHCRCGTRLGWAGWQWQFYVACSWCALSTKAGAAATSLRSLLSALLPPQSCEGGPLS